MEMGFTRTDLICSWARRLNQEAIEIEVMAVPQRALSLGAVVIPTVWLISCDQVLRAIVPNEMRLISALIRAAWRIR